MYQNNSGGIYSWQRIQIVQTKTLTHLMQMNRTRTLTKTQHLRIRTAKIVLIKTAALTKIAATVLTTINYYNLKRVVWYRKRSVGQSKVELYSVLIL